MSGPAIPAATERLIVGPFNRVEGDLEVRLDVAEGRVRSARVTAPMYRGFEPMLLGRDPLDALVIVPRICGICSISQSMAAARALAEAGRISPPRNGQVVCDLLLACENAADHLTHFHLFFMPDFCRPAYAGHAWHARAVARFEALQGAHAREAVAARSRWLRIVGLLGGRWPHTHTLQPGGSARGVEAAECLRLRGWVREFRGFLERQLYGAPLEAVLALRTLDELERWQTQPGAEDADLALWLQIAHTTGMHALGPGPADFVAYGGWPDAAGQLAWPRGRVRRALDGTLHDWPLHLEALAEDATHSWLNAAGEPARHPFDGQTIPEADKPAGYSWAKAPRLGSAVVEVGALARQVVRGQPLACDAVRRFGSTVHTRVLGRLIELAALVVLIEERLAELQPRAPFCLPWTAPREARSAGLTEAARGALGHWLRIEQGRIAGYQIVAPTSWNFSPRDAQGRPGALEAALEGAPVQAGERTPLSVQHIVRSFDPCMVCTAH